MPLRPHRPLRTVGERVDELAIRRALGARPKHILLLVLTQAMRPVLAGILTGVAAAVGLTGILQSMLFGVSATDPATFAAGLAAVAAAACLIPALRAAWADDAVRG